MALPKQQISILFECSKELSDKSFANPLDNRHLLKDVGELIRYGYLKIEPTSKNMIRLTLTEKGRMFI